MPCVQCAHVISILRIVYPLIKLNQALTPVGRLPRSKTKFTTCHWFHVFEPTNIHPHDKIINSARNQPRKRYQTWATWASPEKVSTKLSESCGVFHRWTLLKIRSFFEGSGIHLTGQTRNLSAWRGYNTLPQNWWHIKVSLFLVAGGYEKRLLHIYIYLHLFIYVYVFRIIQLTIGGVMYFRGLVKPIPRRGQPSGRRAFRWHYLLASSWSLTCALGDYRGLGPGRNSKTTMEPWMCMCMYVYIYIYVCVCVYLYVYIYILDIW